MPKGKSEVDLRVSQEIKNHQDWMYQIGQQIQSISQHLVSLSMQHEKTVSKCESDRKEILIAFENFQQEVLNKTSNFFQRLGDLETRCINLQLELGDKLYQFSQNCATKEEHVKSSAFHWGKFKELDEKIKAEKDFVNTEFVKIRGQLNDRVEGFRKDIPSIDEFKPLKKDMENAFQAFKVDFIGLIKEIAILKKAIAYDQKKFENVYTLIERSKAEKK